MSPITLVDRLSHLPVRQHGARESVLVEPRIEYPHPRETLRSERRNHQGVTAQLRLDRIREIQHEPPPNWRAVLHALTVWTPTYSADAVEVVLPPEDAAGLLRADAEENIWDIQSRTGVSMKLEPGARENTAQSLLLSGDRRAIESAVEDIVRVTKKTTRVFLSGEGSRPATSNNEVPSPSGGQDTDTAAAAAAAATPPVPIWAAIPQAPRKLYALKTRADEIPRPKTWTRTSVEEYVAALTMGRLPPTLASSLYPRGTSHDEAVIMQLHRTFNDPNAQQVLSTSVFKQALAFMARKGHTFRPHARALFVRMEMLGLRMDTEVFNLLAESSVKARDLRGFSTTINLMVKREHQPNLRTWILFLRLIKSEEVKRYILHAMDQTGLLSSPHAVKDIAQEMASHDVDRAIQQGKDLTTFLADQNELYGPDWLSRESGNKVLEAFGRHGRFDECAELLDVMSKSTSTKPDIVSLNTVLTHCKVQNNLHKAVDVLELFDARTNVVPNSTTYHLISELGWRHKLPHVTGLVWRYSCLVNKTSYRMRRRAADLLRRSAAIKTAPPILSGGEQTTTSSSSETTTPSPNNLKRFFLSEVTSEAGPAVLSSNALAPGTSPGDAMHRMMQWYKQRHSDFEPAARLVDLLREALARDTQLRRDLKEGRPATVNPVALPTRRRTARQESARSAEGTQRGRSAFRKVNIKGNT